MNLQYSTYGALPVSTLFFAGRHTFRLSNWKEISLIYLQLSTSNYSRHNTSSTCPLYFVWLFYLHLILYKNMPICLISVVSQYFTCFLKVKK